MKKVIIILPIILIIFSLVFISFFVFNKDEKIENKNISVILETEEGNIESDTFPNKENYEYLNTKCENTNDNINVSFNKETWKLNLNIEEESIDGNFNCTVYFKEKKYKVEVNVENGSVDKNSVLVKNNQSTIFNITPNKDYEDILVNCTNNQVGNINGNLLNVSNVTSDTVCSVICNKSKYIFDFTKLDSLDGFYRNKGNGTFSLRSTSPIGLRYDESSPRVPGETNTTEYTYDIERSIIWNDFKFTIEYYVYDYDNALGGFQIHFGNFNYSYMNHWASLSSGTNLYSMIDNEYIINYINSLDGVATFNGSVVIEKKDTLIKVSGGYNQTTELNENIPLKFNSLLIHMENYSTYPQTTMVIKKIIIEKN